MLYGDAGNDRIDGGAAQDKLTGGAGADVFVFTLASDTERHKSDKILDFETRVDKIDLTAIDADTTVAGNQAFVYGTSAAGSASLWMKSGYIYGDTNDDGVADLAIYVKVALGLGDILL
jgi:serralysin